MRHAQYQSTIAPVCTFECLNECHHASRPPTPFYSSHHAAPLGFESNGAGKSALALSAFWAITGSMDARAEGGARPGSGRGLSAQAVVHHGARAARVRVEGAVNGVPFSVERTANK